MTTHKSKRNLLSYREPNKHETSNRGHQIILLCQITIYIYIYIYGCYIQIVAIEYLTTWVLVEHARDKPKIRMQNFYVN